MGHQAHKNEHTSIEINFERETAITSMGFTAWPSVICSSGKNQKLIFICINISQKQKQQINRLHMPDINQLITNVNLISYLEKLYENVIKKKLASTHKQEETSVILAALSNSLASIIKRSVDREFQNRCCTALNLRSCEDVSSSVEKLLQAACDLNSEQQEIVDNENIDFDDYSQKLTAMDEDK